LWANLQTHYDLEVAQMKAGRQIARSVKPIAAALER
jgi:plasmid maintenance system antidote protein VapI